MSVGAIIGIILGVIVIIMVIIGIALFVASYNILMRLRNNAEDGFARLDAQFKKRCELVPAFIQIINSCVNTSDNQTEEIMTARNLALASKNIQEQLENEVILSDNIKSMLAKYQNETSLNSNENYLKLKKDLEQLEKQINISGSFYNDVANIYNNRLELFPSNLIAKWYKFTPKPLFKF